MRTLGLILVLGVLLVLLIVPVTVVLLVSEQRHAEQPEVTVAVPSYAEKLSHGFYRVPGENVTTLYHIHFSSGGGENGTKRVPKPSDGSQTVAGTNMVQKNAEEAKKVTVCAQQDSLGCCRFIGFTHRQGGYEVEIRRPPSLQYDQAVRQALTEWDGLKNIFGHVFSSVALTRQEYDGDNEVGFGTLTAPGFSGVLGLTTMYISTTTDQLLEFDQFYNTGGNSVGFGPTDYHMPSVAYHEFGHVCGIEDHYNPTCAGYLMYGCLAPGEQKSIDAFTRSCIAGENPVSEEALTNDSVCKLGQATCWCSALVLAFVVLVW